MTLTAIYREARKAAKEDIIYSRRSYPSPLRAPAGYFGVRAGTVSRLFPPYGGRGLGEPE
jgi:hypothetical protein